MSQVKLKRYENDEYCMVYGLIAYKMFEMNETNYNTYIIKQQQQEKKT